MLNLIVDGREAVAHPKVLEALQKELRVEIRNLYSADYVPSSRCGIEVKTLSGVIHDWKDKRLKTQMSKLSGQFDKPTLVIMGSLSQLEEESTIPMSAYITSLLNLWLNHGIATFFINKRYLIPFLTSSARLESGLAPEKISIREFKKKAFTDKDVAIRVLTGFKNVSDKRAEDLLNHFGSILNIIKAEAKDFYQVPRLPFNVGPDIQRVCTSDFKSHSFLSRLIYGEE